jgi:alcohol dehydrogenase (cytochrome c)
MVRRPRIACTRAWSHGLLLLPLITACNPMATPPEQRRPQTATSAAIEQIGAVTDELLQSGHKEQPATWPTYGGDWAQTRYSALDEIRRDNVARLRPAWLAQTGIVGSFETTPVVLGQEMYVTTPAEQGVQHVLRLDATTGEVVWRVKLDAEAAGRTAASEDLHLPTDFGPNRGVAVYGNRVYVGTLNGTLLALERRTGARAFEVKTLASRLSGAPLAARGRIVVGLSWLERGAVQAFDAESGTLAWTWYTIPSPEEGGWWGDWVETLPGTDISLDRNIAEEKAQQGRFADAWKKGGAAAPMTPSFDGARGLVYVSTGGPDPHGFPPPSTPYPGDMRWTNSICALRIETGQAAWCRQFLPRDVWGASGTTPPFLIPLAGGGATRDAIARFTGFGKLFVWDRERGDLLKTSDNYMPVPETRGGKGGANLIKGGFAGTNWSPGAYSFRTGLAYSVNQRIPGYFDRRENARSGEQYGSIAAVDPASGEVVWQQRTTRPLGGGLVATAGGLVFAGQTSGWFDAYDDKTGERVWSFHVGAGCNAAPMTYRVGGQQYVAVACGGHEVLDPDGGDTIIAFALVQ